MATFTLTIVGCKEGTSSGPVSGLLGVNATTVNQSEVLENLDLGEAKYSLTGLVKSQNSNEILSDANVDLYIKGTLISSTRTTSEGKFFFFDLPSALYDLRSASNMTAKYVIATYVVRILEDGKTSPANPEISLPPVPIASSTPGAVKVSLSGTVFNVVSKDFIDGETVELQSSTGTLNTVTSGEGKFFFENLTPGIYKLTISRGSQLYQESTLTINVLADGKVSPQSPQIYLKAKAYEDFTMIGYVKNQTGDVVSDIKVNLTRDLASNSPISTTNTTGEGKFFFQNLTSGFYYLVVDSASGTYESSPFPIKILSNGEMSPKIPEVSLLQKSSVRTYKILGRVYEAFTGGPVEYANCDLEGIGNFMSDPKGSFEFANVIPGIYKLTLSKQGFETLVTSIKMNDDGTTTPASLTYPLVNSIRSGYGSIVGRIVNETTGIGVANNIVRLYEWKLVTKRTTVLVGSQAVQISETDWETSENQILMTKTSDTAVSDLIDQKGAFKLTHLWPTDTSSQYLLWVGNSSAQPTFHDEYRVGSHFQWHTVNPSNSSYAFSVSNLSVVAGKTTFYTNYEHEK